MIMKFTKKKIKSLNSYSKFNYITMGGAHFDKNSYNKI